MLCAKSPAPCPAHSRCSRKAGQSFPGLLCPGGTAALQALRLEEAGASVHRILGWMPNALGPPTSHSKRPLPWAVEPICKQRGWLWLLHGRPPRGWAQRRIDLRTAGTCPALSPRRPPGKGTESRSSDSELALSTWHVGPPGHPGPEGACVGRGDHGPLLLGVRIGKGLLAQVSAAHRKPFSRAGGQ